MAAPKLGRFLNDIFLKYNIEYRGFLSNHLSQAVIALHRLGGDETDFQRFYDHYTLKLKDDPAIPSQNKINDETFSQYVGKDLYFLDYVDYFKGKFAQKGRDETVSDFIKILAPGECGAAFHAIIQLGYGYDIESDQVIAEGMAYMAYSNQIFLDARFSECPSGMPLDIPSILSLLQTLRTNPLLQNLCSDVSFQKRTLQLKLPDLCALLNKHSGEKLGDFLTPDGSGIDFPLGLGDEELEVATRRLILITIMIFHQSGANDFFLLHGVSATRGARFTLPAINNRETKNLFLRHLWRAVLETYICQGMPLIRPYTPVEHLKEDEDQQRLREEEQAAAPEREKERERWETLVSQAKFSTEEHIIKMVYVLKDEEERYFKEQKVRERRAFPREMFLKAAEDMMEASGQHGEKFVFNGAGYAKHGEEEKKEE